MTEPEFTVLATWVDAVGDPVTRVGLTPQQYDDIVTRWQMENQLPQWRDVIAASFCRPHRPPPGLWGVPLEIDETSATGWIQRRSGKREPIPGPSPADSTDGV